MSACVILHMGHACTWAMHACMHATVRPGRVVWPRRQGRLESTEDLYDWEGLCKLSFCRADTDINLWKVVSGTRHTWRFDDLRSEPRVLFGMMEVRCSGSTYSIMIVAFR